MVLWKLLAFVDAIRICIEAIKLYPMEMAFCDLVAQSKSHFYARLGSLDKNFPPEATKQYVSFGLHLIQTYPWLPAQLESGTR